MQTSIITFEGKLDNLVGFRNSKGTYSLRKRITPKNPQTKKQVDARTRFLATTNAARILKNSLFGLTNYARQQKISLRNAFVKENYVLASNSTHPDTTSYAYIAAREILIARGDGTNVQHTNIDTETPQQVTLNFTPLNIPGTLEANDLVHAVIYDPKFEKSYHASAKVSEGKVTISNIPRSMSGERVYLYYFTQHFNSAQDRLAYWTGLHDGTDWFEATATASEYASNSTFSYNSLGHEVTIG